MYYIAMGREISAGKTEEMLKQLSEMFEIVRCFGHFNKFLRPTTLHVRNFSTLKLEEILYYNVECRAGVSCQRRDHDQRTAKHIVTGREFSERKLISLSRMYVFLDGYKKARQIKPELPPIPAGIGIYFPDHIQEFNRLLERLLKFSVSTREYLFGSVQADWSMMDRYLGQFIWELFCDNWARLPRPPYGMVR
jgi:hypothetical protein